MLRPAKGGTKRAPMPSRGWRRASSRGSRGLTRTSSACRSRACSSCSQRFQVFDQVQHLPIGELQAEELIVVLHDRQQGGESAVVIEAAFLVRPDSLERSGPVAAVGGTVRLEIINPDFGAGVHRPAWLGVERRNVAGRAARLTVE